MYFISALSTDKTLAFLFFFAGFFWGVMFAIERSPLFSRSSQCSTTGITKAVVCVILSVG